MKKKVVVDIDGVLADFEGAFCAEFGSKNRHMEKLGERYPRNQIAIADFLSDPFVYENLKPISLGLSLIEYLSNRDDVEISIVTARPSITHSITLAWLRRNRIHFDSFCMDTPKTGRISLMKPFCAIDDLLSVYDALFSLNVPCLLISQPWNQGKETKFVNLEQFIDQFSQLEYEYR
jgi:hypothetical protein